MGQGEHSWLTATCTTSKTTRATARASDAWVGDANTGVSASPLASDSWPASEYRTVIQGVVHHGRQNGLMWALRWDDIVDGTVDAEDEANDGFLLWATLQDYSRDTYVGESADYISGDIEIEQLR